MAKFDFIGATIRGYTDVWKHRIALLQLATTPFLIKMGNTAAIQFLGMEEDFLRSGLILIPSYLAEGIFLAYVIRMISAGHKLDGDIERMRLYRRDITAGMITYTLIKLCSAFFVAMMLDSYITQNESPIADPNAVPPNAGSFLLALTTLALMIWAFRLIWLYIPIAMGIHPKQFLLKIKSYMTSFYMMGCWIFCFLPFSLAAMFIYETLGTTFGHTAENPSAAFALARIPFITTLEIISALVVSIAMTYGIKQMMENKDLKN